VTQGKSRARFVGAKCYSSHLVNYFLRSSRVVPFGNCHKQAYCNLAPFVRQTSERKAQTCANEMFRQPSQGPCPYRLRRRSTQDQRTRSSTTSKVANNPRLPAGQQAVKMPASTLTPLTVLGCQLQDGCLDQPLSRFSVVARDNQADSIVLVDRHKQGVPPVPLNEITT
jgi:hypothetical protein